MTSLASTRAAMLVARALLGSMRAAYDPTQPRDDMGRWTSSGSSHLFDTNAMVHGSAKDLTALNPGSMFSNDPTWAAGYTTTSDWAGRETITGGIHEIDIPDGKTIAVRTVHDAEDALIQLGKSHGVTDGSLSDIARVVGERDPELAAIVAKNDAGVVTGGILVKGAPVKGRYEPAEALREATRRGRRVPSNLVKFASLRAAAEKYPILSAADSRARSLETAIRAAMRTASRAGHETAAEALESALGRTLPPALVKVYVAGERAADIPVHRAAYDPDQPRDADGKWTKAAAYAADVARNTNFKSGVFFGSDTAPDSATPGKMSAIAARLSELGIATELVKDIRHRRGYVSIRETESGRLFGPGGFIRSAAFDPNQPRDEQGRWTDGPAGFDADLADVPLARNQNLDDAINAALDQNMLTDDGEIVVYHATIHDPESILKKGLIPSFKEPSGQDWHATHADYATYFHLDPEVAERDTEYGGVVIEARIPLDEKTLARFLPDEDTSDDRDYGLANIITKGGAVAFVGGVPSSALRVRKNITGLRAARRTTHAKRPADDEAKAWAKKHAAELITDISKTTRDRIRRAVAEYKDPRELARAVARIIKDPKRAKMIARTESIRAAHEGQRAAWDKARAAGLIPATMKRQWIATPDEKECPQCEALDGMERRMGKPFPGGVMMPPAHPNCRCTLALS